MNDVVAKLLQIIIVVVAASSSPLCAQESLGPSSRRTGLVFSELMYHPLDAPEGGNLEFIEIFNSNLWFEDLSGYRIDGEINYTFPPGTVLQARQFLVLAKSPAEIQKAYGITNVVGTYAGTLNDKAGLVRLLNPAGGVMLEVNYSDDPPWPVAADGAGHSLVLGYPSYGENRVEAWTASSRAGGSPGKFEVKISGNLGSVRINEFLARPRAGEKQFIELFNHGNQLVDISGCVLTDSPLTNNFIIPEGTIIPPGGFAFFDEESLGFRLDPTGGKIFLKGPDHSRILDAIRYEGQADAQAYGRFPNGHSAWQSLADSTPGEPNASPFAESIVINEIMYAPISGSNDDEYIELYNRSGNTIDMSQWKLAGGIDFIFPDNTTVPSGGFLVVGRNVAQLRSNYANLNSANSIGNFEGRLGNGGERLVLVRTETMAIQQPAGTTATTQLEIVVDEVNYGTEGRWGKWSDGGGSSLELRDPHSDNRLAANWSDSDETAKAPWTPIQATGVLDNGNAQPDSLQVILMGIGECLIDDIEVIGSGATNRVTNSAFSTGLAGWSLVGSHEQSSLEPAGDAQGGPCLHIRSTHRGDTGANKAYTRVRALSVNSTATIRAKARWLCGFPEVLLKLRGNYLEASGQLRLPKNLGTPGVVNSRYSGNASPAIAEVRHMPILPKATEAVVITARIDDPDRVATAVLRYRIDPSSTLSSVLMTDDGTGGDLVGRDGIFSATIPRQTAGSLVAFHIEAQDANEKEQSEGSRFPADAPRRECLIRFGESAPPGAFGTYRLWLTQSTVNRWSSSGRPKLSNEPLDGTFVYDNGRIVYNIGAAFSGSPYHSPSYTGPTGVLCNYSFRFPEDDPFLGVTDFKITGPGNNPGGDSTAVKEQTAYWIAGQLGLPYNYQRNIYLYVNGTRRGQIYEDTQVPDSDGVEQWFPEDAEGELFKIAGWFEFSEGNYNNFQTTWATLQRFNTTGGVKKLARYRWNWQRRGADFTTSNYTNLFNLVDAVNTQGNSYTARVESEIDVEHWMRLFAFNRIIGNWDSYGHQNGQNMFAYRPTQGGWKLLPWDLDIILGDGDGATSPLFGSVDPNISRMTAHPPFRRAYWRALLEAANGPLRSSTFTNLLDAKFAAFRTNGVNANAATTVKTFVASRRNYILQQARSLNVPFNITSSQGADFSTDQAFTILTGAAPVEVKEIRVNGQLLPITWNTVTNWSITVPLANGLNTLVLASYDNQGNLLSQHTGALNVTSTAKPVQDQVVPVVVNEWMASNTRAITNAAGAFDDWFELHNPSAETIDLSQFSLTDNLAEPKKFIIPNGTYISPKGYLLVWADDTTDSGIPGLELHVPFKLSQQGDVIALYDQNSKMIDKVEFGPQANDVSEGRWPENRFSMNYPMLAPTPGSSNIVQAHETAVKLLGVARVEGGVLISWESMIGRRYHVQYKDRLEEAAWRNLIGDVLATGTKAEKVDSMAPLAGRFYRVQLLP